MDEEAKKLVRRLLEEGQRYDDVRRAVISHGYSTEYFEDEYHGIQKELGIEDPKPQPIETPKIDPVLNEEAKQYSQELEAARRSRMMTNVLRLLAGVLVLLGAVILLSGYGDTFRDKILGNMLTNTEDGLGAADANLATQLRSFQISAPPYRAKLLEYSGLCTSIGIDLSLYNCTDTSEAYAIEAQLSNGQYYCVDATGFADTTDTSFGDGSECRK